MRRYVLNCRVRAACGAGSCTNGLGVGDERLLMSLMPLRMYDERIPTDQATSLSIHYISPSVHRLRIVSYCANWSSSTGFSTLCSLHIALSQHILRASHHPGKVLRYMIIVLPSTPNAPTNKLPPLPSTSTFLTCTKHETSLQSSHLLNPRYPTRILSDTSAIIKRAG